MTFLALISGGGTGIGREQAIALGKVEENAMVIITGRRLGPLAHTQSDIGVDKCCHVLADCDVGTIDSWKRIAAKIEELGGSLHFVGNTAGDPGPHVVPYERIDPDAMAAHNASYITGLQLSYHFMAPFLIRGAHQRGVPSVVLDMSSASAVMNRGMAASLPLYYASKVARCAITKSAHGMYKDKGIVAYGICPFVYWTDMVRKGCEDLHVTPEQHAIMLNPLLEQGDAADFGYLSVSAALQKIEGWESGCSYGMFPIPREYGDEKDPGGTGSILYRASAVHGIDLDGLDYDETRRALTAISKAWYSNGNRVPDPTLLKIVEGIEKARRQCLLDEMPGT
jgi:NAD(P)-dependent dehydrogenase (short-subunit alcohol dehydrogenase family)